RSASAMCCSLVTTIAVSFQTLLNELVHRCELVDGSTGVIDELLEICLINAVQREVELLESLSFHPEISLSTTDCVELSFLLTKEHATAGISVDRHETTSPTDELRTLVLEHGLLNRIEVDVQSR